MFPDTAVSEIEDCFKRFLKRDDIDIILINQNVAELIRHVIDSHTQPVPSILEIPSKDHPYDASKDSILRRARVYILYIYICTTPNTATLSSEAGGLYVQGKINTQVEQPYYSK